MKHLLLLSFASIFSGVLFSQYKPLDKGSKVEFKIKNMGFTVSGTFTGISGNIIFDPARLPASSISVSVDASTVNTDNSLRDDHLRGDGYFDVKKYPKIYFVSTNIVRAGKTTFSVTGRLTIKNVSREISFPFIATESNGNYEFKGSFNINRRDFDVGGLSIISDNLAVNLDVLASK